MKNYKFVAHEAAYEKNNGDDDQYNLLKIYGIEPDKDPLTLKGPGGESFVFHKVAATTEGRYTLAELTFNPGPGPFPHIHHFEDEWVYIAEGIVQLACANAMHPDINDIPGKTSPKDVLHTMIAGPGTLVYMPRYMVHTFSNAGLTKARMYAVWAAGGIENFFKASVNLTPEQMAEIGPKYGIVIGSTRDQFVSDTIVGGSCCTDNNLNRLVELLQQPSSSVMSWKQEDGVWSYAREAE